MSDDLIAQLVDPADARLSRGSTVRVQWRCLVDPRHIWSASPNTRRTNGCPVCANRLILPGVNDLATTHPDLAGEVVDPDDAKGVHATTKKSIRWRCRTDPDHTWFMPVFSRTRLGCGCPICSGFSVVAGVNDLATTHPHLAAQLVTPAVATAVHAGSTRELQWRCPDNPGHVWTAQVRTRTGVFRKPRKPSSCPHCCGRAHRPRPGSNPTVQEIGSPILAEAVDPERVGRLTTGSGVLVAWWCPECLGGHEYVMSVRHKLRGYRCPVIAGTQVLAGVNDLATTHPELCAELADPSIGTRISHGSTQPVAWRCAAGHTWQAPPYARAAGNRCPACSPVGSSRGEQHMVAVLQVLEPSTTHRARVHYQPPNAPGRSVVEVDAVAGRLGVEFNGLYWHSEAVDPDPGRLRTKVERIRASSHQPVVVWADQWDDLTKRAIVVRMFAHRLGALDRLGDACAQAGVSFDPRWVERHGARTLSVVECGQSEASKFFDVHHIQGATAVTRSFALVDADGVFHAVLGLRSARHNARLNRVSGQWDVQRYATVGQVPGGFTRLLAHAETTLLAEGIPLTAWLSISDDSMFDGHLYRSAGFTVAGAIKPSYWYTNGPARDKRVTKESFQVKHFRRRSDLAYIEGQTEHEAALANGLLRVWDAGRTRWIRPVGRQGG